MEAFGYAVIFMKRLLHSTSLPTTVLYKKTTDQVE
jgi:hypothetical protein